MPGSDSWWDRQDDFEGEAESFVLASGISEPPVDLMHWCRDEDFIRVREVDLRGECDGLLRFKHGRFHLFYDSDPYKRRFNFAHEVAHYLMEEHAKAIADGGGQHASQAGFISDKQMEREADWFATGLLMPGFLFEPRCPDPNFRDIIKVAEAFDVSLTAAALRTTRFTQIRTALVSSSAESIKWCWCSEGMVFSGVFRARKGNPPPRRSKTAEVLGNPEKFTPEPTEGGKCFASEWFEVKREDPVLWEEVFPMPEFSRALTLLTFFED